MGPKVLLFLAKAFFMKGDLNRSNYHIKEK